MSSNSVATSHENRLAHETSPYLLQHKHNPVDCWPWETGGPLMSRLRTSAMSTGRVVIAAPNLDRAADQLLSLIDPVDGSIRGARELPLSMMLESLWRACWRTNDYRRFAAVELTHACIC